MNSSVFDNMILKSTGEQSGLLASLGGYIGSLAVH